MPSLDPDFNTTRWRLPPPTSQPWLVAVPARSSDSRNTPQHALGQRRALCHIEPAKTETEARGLGSNFEISMHSCSMHEGTQG